MLGAMFGLAMTGPGSVESPSIEQRTVGSELDDDIACQSKIDDVLTPGDR